MLAKWHGGKHVTHADCRRSQAFPSSFALDRDLGGTAMKEDEGLFLIVAVFGTSALVSAVLIGWVFYTIGAGQ